MPNQTAPERIIALFEHLWPSEIFSIRSDVGSQTVSLVISSKDFLTTYARVRFEPKNWADGNIATTGYKVEISYAAFNGSLEDMTPNLFVITMVNGVIKAMQEVSLIKGE